MDDIAAFIGESCLACGPAAHVAPLVRRALGAGPGAVAVVLEMTTGRVVDLDLRGTEAEIAARYAAPGRARGRPKLGVTAREVTLLPRHWDWLGAQPGGASATLRRLVEAARKADRAGPGRQARDAAYRAMQVLAGDRPGYEEALRALYAGQAARFAELIAPWPDDIRDFVARLARGETQGEEPT